MSKTYVAPCFGLVFVSVVGQPKRQLAPRLDLFSHSPSGFAWGYHGSGPAQLALAILADHLGDDQRALRLYQRFKARALATRAADTALFLDAVEVDEHVAAIEREFSNEGGDQ